MDALGSRLTLTLPLILSFNLFSLVPAAHAASDLELKALWTPGMRAAVVPIQSENRRGTGFVVRANNGRYYVLTAAHVLWGAIDPTAPAKAGEVREPIPANTCEPVDKDAYQIRQEGIVLEAECIRYLGHPDLAVIKLKDTTRHPSALPTARFHADRDLRLSRLGYPGGASALEVTPTLGDVNTVEAPLDGIRITMPNIKGLSGAPYLSAQGRVVGLHSGVLEDDTSAYPGYVVMIPLANAESELTGLNLPLDGPIPPPVTPDTLAKPPVFATGVAAPLVIEVRDQRPSRTAIQPSPRPPAMGEVQVSLEQDGNTRVTGIVGDTAAGRYTLSCPACSPGRYQVQAVNVAAPALYKLASPVESELPLPGTQPLLVALSHRQNLGAIAFNLAVRKIDDLKASPSVPACLNTSVASDLLRCRTDQTTVANIPYQVAVREIRSTFRTALEDGAEWQQPDANRNLGTFLIANGLPCEARDPLWAAATSGSFLGAQPPNEWLNALIACISDPASAAGGNDALRDALDQLVATLAPDSIAVLARIDATFIRETTKLLLRLGDGNPQLAADRIALDPNLRDTVADLMDRALAPWCRIAKPYGPYIAILQELQRKVRTGACTASAATPGAKIVPASTPPPARTNLPAATAIPGTSPSNHGSFRVGPLPR